MQRDGAGVDVRERLVALVDRQGEQGEQAREPPAAIAVSSPGASPMWRESAITAPSPNSGIVGTK